MSANNKILPTKPTLVHNLQYGIGGIRGVYGRFPICPKPVFALGQALAALSKQATGQKSVQVLLLCDTRSSCDPLLEALRQGLNAQQVVAVNCGILPTPAAPVLLQAFPEAKFAVVISASHNSAEFNGIKIFSRAGNLTPQQIIDLNQAFAFFYDSNFVPKSSWPNSIDSVAEAFKHYKNFILAQFTATEFSGVGTVLLDCGHGAASVIAPEIFRQLGIKCAIINNQPNGENINALAGSTHAQLLSKAVQEFKAVVGFSFDGDSDRVIALDSAGLVKDGDDILAVLSGARKFATSSKVVGTIMSNSGLAFWLAAQGKELLRSDVGQSNVALLMQQGNIAVGGEPSGHVLTSTHAHSSDAILVALETLSALRAQGNLAFKTFDRLFSGLTCVAVTKKLALDSKEIQDFVAQAEVQLHPGRILLRYSQTEPILRVLVEALDHSVGAGVLQNLTLQIKKVFERDNPINLSM